MKNSILQFFGINADPIIGLDISSSAVKIMQISKKSGMLTVDKYGIEQLTPGSVVEKSIKDPIAVATAIDKALRKARVDTNLVCISVPSSEAITRVIQLNKDLTDIEIKNEIEIEADRYIPYAIDEVNLDFEVLGTSSKSEDLIDVLLAVSKTENIDSRIELLEQVDLSAQIVDIDTYAVERAFALVLNQLADREEDITGLIEIGASVTTLTVFEGSKAIYSKDQTFGGSHLTNEIQARYGLSYEEALLARRYGDLPDDYVPEVLTPFKETVAQQINRICQYFYAASEQESIKNLFIAGGIANISGLEDVVSEALNIKTFVANPFSGMALAPEINQDGLMSDAPMLLGCCGLALRNVM